VGLSGDVRHVLVRVGLLSVIRVEMGCGVPAGDEEFRCRRHNTASQGAIREQLSASNRIDRGNDRQQNADKIDGV
jgi:hypothetical protein